MSASLEIEAGARAAEQRLLEVVGELRDEARRDPRLLARPVRVVVPSRSLRLHLGERIGTVLGAVAGVELQTLHGLAIGVLERAGIDVPSGDALVEVLARRLAGEERALSSAFEPFRDGYRTVAGTVRDLFDAGFEPEQADALLERIAELSLSRAERARADAVVRTAARVAEALAERGVGGRSELLRRAREAFEADPEGTLPTRLLVLHGFADATGRATDLLEALLRRLDARVLFDHPPDPEDASRADLGVAFAERLLERLQGAAGRPTAASTPEGGAAAPEIDVFRAPGASAEARAVAQRIRELVDAGTALERIGVVARDLTSYRAPIRTQFARLGVPFSALRTRAPLDGVGRRIAALVQLLEMRERTPADRWLDAVATLARSRDGERVVRRVSPELRLGLRVVGATRLGDTPDAPFAGRLEKGVLKLPVRVSVAARGEAEPGVRDAIGFHATRARLRGEELSAAVDEAAKLLRRFARWPRRATLARHVTELEKLRRAALGWKATDPAERRVAGALQRLAEAFPEEELTFDELVLLARRAVMPAAAPPFGRTGEGGEGGGPSDGAGGGVAILDAMEARGRTFEHLFVLGLNRDVFPRVGREDPLLSDDVRRALTVVLPDVPIAARGRDEDRYLFAQLVSSSPRVTLSWQLADDDGKPRVVSPLVERLLGEASEDTVAAVPKVFPLRAGEVSGLHTAAERAVLGGLHARREGFERRLEAALAETAAGAAGAHGVDRVRTKAVAGTRAAVLAAWEEGPFEPARLAPWLGFIGEQSEVGIRPDPREEPLSVTRFEAVARCPWQAVLRRLLQLEAAPDPLDALPGIEPRVVGNIVHGVLEALVVERTGEKVTLAEALGRTPVRVDWPEAARLEEVLLAVTRDEVAKDRAPLAGLVRMLAECARPHLERARRFFEEEQARWPSIGALGAEVTGRARVPLRNGAGHAELTFRADRVDRRDGTLILSDYKTGQVSKETSHRTQGIARGLELQPMVYVLGAMGVDPSLEARGRYLFTQADGEKERVDVGPGGDTFDEQRADFEAAIDTIVRGWLAGTFFPRLHDEIKDRGNDICRFCEVASACVNGDSGAKRAVLALGRGEEDAGAAGEVLTDLWRLATAGGKR